MGKNKNKGIVETVSLETVPETSATLHHHIDPTKEDSPADENMSGSSSKKSKRRKKKKSKEEALGEDEKTLDVSAKNTDEDQLHPPKNPLSNITAQEDSCQQAQDSCEKPGDSEPGALDMTSSEGTKKRRKKKKAKDINALGENSVDTNSEVTTKCDAKHNSEAQGSNLKSKKKKNVDGTVVNGSLISKDDTEDQLECADAKAGDTVSETQNPKAKKKKRRKTETVEVSDALENTLATSMESGPVECMETAGVCEVKSKKRKKKKKTSSTDQETADMEVCDPSESTLLGTIESGSVGCLLDHSNNEVMEHCDKNDGEEFVGEDRLSKTENSATGEICEPKQKKSKKKKSCELTEEVSEPKQKKSKKKKKSCELSEEVGEPKQKKSKKEKKSCELSEEVSEPKQKKSKKEKKSCELSEEVSEPKQKKSKKEKKSCELSEEVSEPKQKKSKKEKKSCELSEEVSEPKKKKSKKKKSCEDHETDDMDAEKDDVSVPRNEGELEVDREKLDTHLSSSVLIHDNMTQGVVASQETADLPRCSCNGQSSRKLVVFDLNGILADIARGNTGKCVPDGKISSRSVFKRPFVATFLDFCFEKFDVGIWSSRRIGLDYMTHIVMGNHARNLLFSFGQNKCITTKFKTLENTTKPLFLKDLRKVWNRFGTCLSCRKQKYDETNTLLVDDSPDKALCNPPHTGIFPFPYQYTDREDSALGPDGELRKYMERLVDAENVQKFVEENPIGQSAITDRHESWSFYSRVIEAHKK
ncbi:unnamed protein product [Eruca vesicaria subsp. sativa]|uniref:FCP1 homology domain-containing protein n=1 Tax=Eruca vesicaria subsp. sativa TaxID=29727 RepID=A0ABC8KN59_ERUVS|nr:unnamed protein product [Eruca vesicaria subsp. sativa]